MKLVLYPNHVYIVQAVNEKFTFIYDSNVLYRFYPFGVSSYVIFPCIDFYTREEFDLSEKMLSDCFEFSNTYFKDVTLLLKETFKHHFIEE
jgi:hypothetical protein